MATSAKFAAPPTAVRIWCAGLTLYAEIPGDPPYIHAESICEAGLWKMLNLLRAKALSTPIGSHAIATQIVDRFGPCVKQGKPRDGTAEQRGRALDVLKRLGMVGK